MSARPPVLTLPILIADTECVSAPDRELVANVLELLDVSDDETVTDSFLLYEWIPAIAAAMRAILLPHRQDRTGRCAGCPPATRWPCPAWRAAHRWMFELDPETGGRRDVEGYYVVTLSGRA